MTEEDPGLKPPLQRLFSIRHEFQNEWYAFLQAKADVQAELKLDITSEHFPFLFRGKNIGIQRVELLLKAKDGKFLNDEMPTFGDNENDNLKLMPPAAEGSSETETEQGGKWAKWLEQSAKVTLLQTGPMEPTDPDNPWETGEWIIRQPVNTNSLYKESVEDLILVFTYTVTD